MNAIRSFRARTNRRALALLAVLAIALSGTGIASLAQLNDLVTATVNASVTTIELNVNGTKSATIDLPVGLEPGEIAYASLQFVNSGSGYVNIPSNTNVISGGQALMADTVAKVWTAAPENCNAGGGLNITGAVPLSDDLWDSPITLDAGGTLNKCIVYRVGQTNGDYTGATAWSIRYDFDAFYP